MKNSSLFFFSQLALNFPTVCLHLNPSIMVVHNIMESFCIAERSIFLNDLCHYMVFSISEFPANIYTFITYGIAYALPPVSTFSILYQYYIHQSFLYTKPIISHIWYCITVSSLVEPPPPFWGTSPVLGTSSFWSKFKKFESHPNWCMQIAWNTLKRSSFILY